MSYDRPCMLMLLGWVLCKCLPSCCLLAELIQQTLTVLSLIRGGVLVTCPCTTAGQDVALGMLSSVVRACSYKLLADLLAPGTNHNCMVWCTVSWRPGMLALCTASCYTNSSESCTLRKNQIVPSVQCCNRKAILTSSSTESHCMCC